MITVRLATHAMGTRFEIVLEGRDEARLRAAGEAAIERIEDAHRTLTRFDPASLLGHLRRVSPRAVPVDREVFGLFAAAERVRRDSDGGFDITGGPGGIALDPEAVTVALLDPTVPLDLGAIAKGYAVDLAADTLRESGIECGFVHGGTSSAIGIGRPGAGGSWRVALGADPSSPMIDLTDAALSVSASIARRGAALIPHIHDPRTGRPPGDRRVAVRGATAMLADAWSTAAVVLGRRPTGLDAGWRVWFEEPGDRWTEHGPAA